MSIESKIEMDEERYVDAFKPYMMDVIKAWVDGQSFASICKMTSIYEGNSMNEAKSSPILTLSIMNRFDCALCKTT